VRVRLALGNPRGRLKPGMFASVSMALPARSALLVPRDAVVDSGTRRIVFVAQGDGYFEPRDVTIGRRLDGRIEVLAGVTEGESVASAATFFIDSESQINAALGGFTAAPAPGAPAAPPITATLRTSPDPPRAGDNEFEITVRGPDGAPLAGDEAAVVFFMPAMPSMNMPAMRSDARLPHVGGGVYRGRADLMMSGKWDLTVTVNRGGQAAGTARLPLLAK
jgi:Cu(I)/Ag(I) efflux system membrane fusion protein/cobalt-zinc-cadmium efflux system membrane fusion protein